MVIFDPALSRQLSAAGIFVLLLNLVLIQVVRAESDLVATIQKIKPSVVGVGIYKQTRVPPAVVLATGFVVGDGHHVITNEHVVSRLPAGMDSGDLVVFTGHGKQASVRKATLLKTDVTHDLAILRIEGKALPPVIIGEPGMIMEGTPIAFTGYPIGAILGLYPATHSGRVAAIPPYIIPKDHASRLDSVAISNLRDPFYVFQLDAVSYPGNSGSPVYEQDTGRVIAVISSGVVIKARKETAINPGLISFAIPATYVKRLMKMVGLME